MSFLTLNLSEEELGHDTIAINIGAQFPNLRNNNVYILSMFLSTVELSYLSVTYAQVRECLFHYLMSHYISTSLAMTDYLIEMKDIGNELYRLAIELNFELEAQVNVLFQCVSEVFERMQHSEISDLSVPGKRRRID